MIEISCPFVFAQSGLINDLHTSSSCIQDPGSLTFLPLVDPEQPAQASSEPGTHSPILFTGLGLSK